MHFIDNTSQPRAGDLGAVKPAAQSERSGMTASPAMVCTRCNEVRGIVIKSEPLEIDQWIEANEDQAAEAHAAWSAGQDAIRP